MARNETPACYRITVQGRLDSRWSEWFGGLTVETTNQDHGRICTTLYGPVTDQAQLRSLLTRIWDLNLTLVYLERVDEETNER